MYMMGRNLLHKELEKMDEEIKLTEEEEQPQPSRHKWEQLNVSPVDMPIESYGNCSRKSCKKVEVLGNGLCEECWDKGHRPSKDRSSRKRIRENIATWDILSYLQDKSDGGS